MHPVRIVEKMRDTLSLSRYKPSSWDFYTLLIGLTRAPSLFYEVVAFNLREDERIFSFSFDNFHPWFQHKICFNFFFKYEFVLIEEFIHLNEDSCYRIMITCNLVNPIISFLFELRYKCNAQRIRGVKTAANDRGFQTLPPR